jgi:transposase-like protein
MKRRNFTAAFKTKLVLEALEGIEDINAIAVKNDLSPNLLRNWKSEFLKNASMIFDVGRDDKLKDELKEKVDQLEQSYQKIGQLTIQVDWLKKKSAELLDPGAED